MVTFNRPALTVLGASAFCYVTAETLPVGLLPQIAGVSRSTNPTSGCC
ncbi:hypothetical protein [Paractinoplanes durhamensis]